MNNIPSFLSDSFPSENSMFIVPGCTKCERAKNILIEQGIPFQSYPIFKHRDLLQNVPYEKKRKGFPLLKINHDYYTYDEIKNIKETVSLLGEYEKTVIQMNEMNQSNDKYLKVFPVYQP
ncbi:glutaredoxin domain-containing protein [Paenisporosarcina sp. TG20]|uniref:glutaredoxin domain-containing protein n=1 Tax=Paenisporosarcina sp. TG20 TaxID=1211706 RepID=UPI0002F23CC1|nr:glutaredoxin domain-containing protein [Paenisporosarcina sp. TG20]